MKKASIMALSIAILANHSEVIATFNPNEIENDIFTNATGQVKSISSQEEIVQYRLAAEGNHSPFPFTVVGFANAEPTHIWTSANQASIKVPVLEGQNRVKSLTLKGTSGFLPNNHEQKISVGLLGEQGREYTYNSISPTHDIKIQIPDNLIGEAEIIFSLPTACRPCDWFPESQDNRLISLMLNAIEISYSKPTIQINNGQISQYHLGQSDLPHPFVVTGFSWAEGPHRWTDGTQTKVTMPIEHDSKRLSRISFKGTSAYGEQELSVSVNGIPYNKYIYNMGSPLHDINIDFSLDLTGNVDFTFDMPKACQPGQGDNRVLAIALRSVDVTYLSVMGALPNTPMSGSTGSEALPNEAMMKKGTPPKRPPPMPAKSLSSSPRKPATTLTPTKKTETNEKKQVTPRSPQGPQSKGSFDITSSPKFKQLAQMAENESVKTPSKNAEVVPEKTVNVQPVKSNSNIVGLDQEIDTRFSQYPSRVIKQVKEEVNAMRALAQKIFDTEGLNYEQLLNAIKECTDSREDIGAIKKKYRLDLREKYNLFNTNIEKETADYESRMLKRAESEKTRNEKRVNNSMSASGSNKTATSSGGLDLNEMLKVQLKKVGSSSDAPKTL